ncbi:micrococcal nuclease [Paenibacillus sp. V4I9]|uniref:thermonuclease family protein n=1 Tax=Paenibacillus sp. V4I9 TaxID=3042308 RepID=UPI002788E8F0|nr:thermonuclease family protein [Paenibacillus sp. V4I9]MDQ0885928.1 micrococcal nuclease [Paenibacillus sp. V4I9]
MLNERKVKKLLISAAVSLIVIFVVAGCSQDIQKPLAATNVESKASGVIASPIPSPLATVLPTPTKEQAKPTTTPESTNKLISAKILKVVDGDTMKVSFNEGGKVKEETIRLLLVDTPESVDPEKPVQPFALDASKYAKDTLSDKDVKLEIDVSERDKYGRLLCYLYIGDKMFNEMLLENGYARVAYVYPPNVKYVDKFREIQKTAQQKGVNIWSVENYAQEDGFHEGVVKAKESPSPKPVPTTTPKPVPVAETNSGSSSNVYYNNCTEAKAAGAYNIKRGEPGYSSKLDRDNDGVACEK